MRALMMSLAVTVAGLSAGPAAAGGGSRRAAVVAPKKSVGDGRSSLWRIRSFVPGLRRATWRDAAGDVIDTRDRLRTREARITALGRRAEYDAFARRVDEHSAKRSGAALAIDRAADARAWASNMAGYRKGEGLFRGARSLRADAAQARRDGRGARRKLRRSEQALARLDRERAGWESFLAPIEKADRVADTVERLRVLRDDALGRSRADSLFHLLSQTGKTRLDAFLDEAEPLVDRRARLNIRLTRSQNRGEQKAVARDLGRNDAQLGKLAAEAGHLAPILDKPEVQDILAQPRER